MAWRRRISPGGKAAPQGNCRHGAPARAPGPLLGLTRCAGLLERTAEQRRGLDQYRRFAGPAKIFRPAALNPRQRKMRRSAVLSGETTALRKVPRRKQWNL